MCGDITKKFWSIFAVVMALVLGVGFVHAQEKKTMPIEFVGEWCFASQENQTTYYSLPSWIEDGHCTKIIGIDQYGWFDDTESCQALKVHLTHDTAPSGTSYMATVTARCNPNNVVISSPQQTTIKTFEFGRHKGNLTVFTKGTRPRSSSNNR